MKLMKNKLNINETPKEFIYSIGLYALFYGTLGLFWSCPKNKGG